MAEPKFTYGLDVNGTLVHVNDVNRGEACNCICIECKQPLVAKKSEARKKQWHFAHKVTTNCQGGRMTALHMLAQQIIQEEKKIRKPWFKDYCEDPSKEIYFESVLLEQRFKTTEINRRPDCVGIIKNGDKQYEVWIEVKVKHAIDEEKKKDIIKLGAICMEIDLTKLLDTDYTKENIREALFNDVENKVWINYPQLFRKNEKSKRIFEEEKARKEAEHLAYLQSEENRIVGFVNSWMESGTKESKDTLIKLIQSDPYNELGCPYTIFEVLIPYNDFITWIKKSPRNSAALDLFYTVARYYYRKMSDTDIIELTKELNQYQFKRFIDEGERIILEQLVSLRVIRQLTLICRRNTEVDLNDIKQLCKKYYTNAGFRNLCLKVLSIEFRHILGSACSTFNELTKEIYNTSSDILPLYLEVLDHAYETKLPKYNLPRQDEEIIEQCRKYTAIHKENINEECQKLLLLAFKYLFSKKTLNIEKDTEIVIPEDIDMTDYKQYSYDELVKGFAELGKKLDNSSRSKTDC